MFCRATGLSHQWICLVMSCKVVKQWTHLPPLYPPATPRSKLPCSFSRRGGLNREVPTLHFHPFYCFFIFLRKKVKQEGGSLTEAHNECIQLPQEPNVLTLLPLARQKPSKRMQHQGRDNLQATLKPGHPRISLLTQPLHMWIIWLHGRYYMSCIQILHDLDTSMWRSRRNKRFTDLYARQQRKQILSPQN